MLALRGKEAPNALEKKKLTAQLKSLEEKISIEIKARIKHEFNYAIPIAEVEKAGISTTGAQIENELEPLVKEFTEYRKLNSLWEAKFDSITYKTIEDGSLYRVVTTASTGEAKEPEVFYG